MTQISTLKKGDTIVILAPAKSIEEKHVLFAKDFFEKEGFNVLISKHCLGTYNYFSGTDAERTLDFQQAIDDPNIKAIVCARGGYGAIRIVDSIQWAGQLRFPKWIIGFSDVTVFHQKMQSMNLKSIHSTMPLNFENNSKEALSTLIKALKGEAFEIQIKSNEKNKIGKAEGELIGGNLSIVYSLLGTDIKPKYKGKILFLEEVGEQLYAIDRMFFSLKKSGVLDEISGLIIGGMTDLKDTTQNTIGMNIEEIVLNHFEYRNIPICFDFPAGHIDDNRALVLGNKVELIVDKENSKLKPIFE